MITEEPYYLTEMAIDEISGAEVPKKCCENCSKHFPIGYSICANVFDSSVSPWDTKNDFCSRFELKKENEK